MSLSISGHISLGDGPISQRIRYGFCHVYKPVLDDTSSERLTRWPNSVCDVRRNCRRTWAAAELIDAQNHKRPARLLPEASQELACAFAEHGVDCLFIGKSGAILLDFSGTTQDVDIYSASPRRVEHERHHPPALMSVQEIVLEREGTDG